MNCKSKKEGGYITIEASFALVIFIAAVACIVSLINIYTLHNRIQYAITQTANQLSTYMYIYDGLGLQGLVEGFDADKDKATEDVNDLANNAANTVVSAQDFGDSLMNVVSSLGAIADSTDSVTNTVASSDFSVQSIEQLINELKQVRTSVDNVKQNAEDAKDKFGTLKDDFSTTKGSASEFIKSVRENPYTLVLTVFYLAAGELEDYVKETVSENLASALTQQYLMGDDADNYLSGMGVVSGYEGLSFHGSNFFVPLTRQADEKKYESVTERSLDVLLIDVVVTYKVELDFPLVPLSDNTVTIVQKASTTAWTGHKKS